jgi:hypothetical protein
MFTETSLMYIHICLPKIKHNSNKTQRISFKYLRFRNDMQDGRHNIYRHLYKLFVPEQDGSPHSLLSDIVASQI